MSGATDPSPAADVPREHNGRTGHAPTARPGRGPARSRATDVRALASPGAAPTGCVQSPGDDESRDDVAGRVATVLRSTAGAVGPASWRAERAMCWIRIVAVTFGMSTVLFNRQAVTGSIKVAALAVMAAYGLASLAVVVRYRDRPPRGWRTDRVLTATLVADGLLIIGLTTLLAGAPMERAWVLPVLLPLVGGLKAGPRGAAVGVVGMIVAETAGHLVRVQVHGLTADLETQISFVGIGAIGGALAGWVARLAASERHRAETATRHLEAIHEVVLSGLGGGVDAVIPRMVDALRVRLQQQGIVLALVDDEGILRFARTSGIDVEAGSEVPLDEGGPASRVLAGGPPQLIGPDLLRDVTLCRDDARSAVMSAIRANDQIIGLLVLVSSEQVYGTEDLVLADRLAYQMGLVIEAARAFDREASLVDRYRQLDSMRTDFVSLTSHELRTPMTAIVGIAETLLHRDIADPAKRRELAAAIVRQGKRLERLVEDLRTVSVLDAGGLRIVPRRCSITEVLRAPVEAVSPAAVVLEGDVDVRLFCDPDRATQIVANLIDNALQHGAEPVTVRWHRIGEDVAIEVADGGTGIDPDRRERIFERFETSADMLTHHRGTGLGLPIARELARAMGGDLVLVDAAHGTCFRITLPASSVATDLRLAEPVEVADVR